MTDKRRRSGARRWRRPTESIIREGGPKSIEKRGFLVVFALFRPGKTPVFWWFLKTSLSPTRFKNTGFLVVFKINRREAGFQNHQKPCKKPENPKVDPAKNGLFPKNSIKVHSFLRKNAAKNVQLPPPKTDGFIEKPHRARGVLKKVCKALPTAR